ncbi:MAG: Na+/H+ antiporter subunit B [Planctomycetota bacterium]|nr:MAG: Na+/H+ antiporter subunit B [Planctomycetota bacterium]
MSTSTGSSSSVILAAIARLLMPLLIMASLFLLLRGHNEPGGGFIGGLLGGVAFVLTAVAFGPLAARRALMISPYSLIPWGMGFAILGALIPLAFGQPFFSPVWSDEIPFAGEVFKVGTPLVFDIGVYLLVVGIAVIFVLTLMEVDLEEHDPEGMDSDEIKMADSAQEGQE